MTIVQMIIESNDLQVATNQIVLSEIELGRRMSCNRDDTTQENKRWLLECNEELAAANEILRGSSRRA